jgi:hypothetical protein
MVDRLAASQLVTSRIIQETTVTINLAGAALVAALLLIAAKPVATESSIAIADGSVLAFGGAVTFDVSGIPHNVKNPRIEVLCYQSGALVYGEGGSAFDTFLLGGGWSPWHSSPGPADCIANLFYWRSGAGHQVYEPLASIPFVAKG